MSTARNLKAGSEKHRNRRVRRIDGETWKRERNVRFRRSVSYAAAAKATRTAFEVTQEELAYHMNLSVTSIQLRENGFHSWSGGPSELAAYQNECARIAKGF